MVGLSTGDLQAMAVTRFFEIQGEASVPERSPVASGAHLVPVAPSNSETELVAERELGNGENNIADDLFADLLLLDTL